MNSQKEPEKVSLSEEQLNELESKIKGSNLDESAQELLVKSLRGMIWLSKMLEAKKLSIRKLSKLFGFKTEKSPATSSSSPEKKRPKDSGPAADNRNGKNGHDKLTGAKRVFHQHQELSKGDCCLGCGKGKLYHVTPGIFVHIQGAAPLTATVHEAEKLRCATCGAIFVADVPQEARVQKYDETADAMIALMKYGAGTPFYRLSKLQKALGVPLPASTQWERVEELSNSVYPVFRHLVKLGAQAEVAHVDDTTGKILSLKKELKNQERQGIYTTGIVSRCGDKTINLFFTGNRHAGENLDELLKHRSKELPPLIQMSDGLASNRPKNAQTTLCGCLTHCRRGFFDALNDWKKEGEYVLGVLRKIYRNDSVALDRKLTDVERMNWHQKRSAPLMSKLRRWGLKCFYLKKVNPDGNLGQALQYMFNHWEKLTQFLRVPGAPLENNIVERLLKTAILHRKNALFFKTWMGALVGDIMMSLIQTCVSAGKNPFDYLVTLHKNRKAVRCSPERFLPWNYEVT